jgi:hypothetical protein
MRNPDVFRYIARVRGMERGDVQPCREYLININGPSLQCELQNPRLAPRRGERLAAPRSEALSLFTLRCAVAAKSTVIGMARIHASIAIWLATMSVAVAAADDNRKYEEGPLTAADFRAEPQDIPAAAAKTATQLGHDFRYRYKSTARNTTVTLESITIEAYIRRNRSWNRKPDDKALLDHEQGHADIAQIHCLQARLAFRKLQRGPGLSVTASSLKEATAALERELDKLMAVYEQAACDADAEYDRETRNGLGGKQAEWRRVQRETIEQLEAQWRTKKRPASE